MYMTKRFFLLRVMLAALLAVQALIGPAHALAAQTTARVSQSPIEEALKSAGTVQAIIELESAPVAQRPRAQISMMQRDQRADFSSAEALALDSQLRGEQEEFKARARLVAPGLRV